MRLSTRAAWVAALVSLTFVGRAPALTPVVDKAAIFAPAAVREANEAVKEIDDLYLKELVIRTFKEAPSKDAAKFKKDPQRAFADWAKKNAKALRFDGIYVLICQEPWHVQVNLHNLKSPGGFTDKDSNELRDLLLSKLGGEHKEEALREAVAFVRERLDSNLGGPSKRPYDWPAMSGVVLTLVLAWVVLAFAHVATGGSWDPGYAGVSTSGVGVNFAFLPVLFAARRKKGDDSSAHAAEAQPENLASTEHPGLATPGNDPTEEAEKKDIEHYP